jgi:hypothetical protein
MVNNDLGAVTIRVTPLLHNHSFDAADSSADTGTAVSASADSTAEAANGSSDAAIDTKSTDLITATSSSTTSSSSSSPAERQLRLLQLQLLQQQRPIGSQSTATLGRSAAALLYSVLMLAPYAAGGAVRRVLRGGTVPDEGDVGGECDPEVTSEYAQRVTALVLNYEVSS